VNVNPLYTAHEMIQLFRDAEPAAIVGINMFADKLSSTWSKSHPACNTDRGSESLPNSLTLADRFCAEIRQEEVPASRFRHTTFAKALALGAARIRAGPVSRLTRKAWSLPPSRACNNTGGTTGVSKGAILTHRNLIMNVAQFLTFHGDSMRESDHVLTVLPLYHIFAFTANMLGFFRSWRA